MTPHLPETISGGDGSLVLLCDHASNAVPEDVKLGVTDETLAKHVAIDIGAEPLTRALAARLDAPAILATVSRLVIDLHREAHHPDLIPSISDGHLVPGNTLPDIPGRIARFHEPYHASIAELVASTEPVLIAAIHSFTPTLESGGAERPWEIGILYNRDERASKIAIEWAKGQGIVTGDNDPYSGRLLNATLNRHGEANEIPCLSIEVRNDLIADEAGVARWAETVEAMLRHVRQHLASEGSSAT